MIPKERQGGEIQTLAGLVKKAREPQVLKMHGNPSFFYCFLFFFSTLNTYSEALL
jgi:hypothetical protein